MGHRVTSVTGRSSGPTHIEGHQAGRRLRPPRYGKGGSMASLHHHIGVLLTFSLLSGCGGDRARSGAGSDTTGAAAATRDSSTAPPAAATADTAKPPSPPAAAPGESGAKHTATAPG